MTDQEMYELEMKWKREYLANIKHAPSVLYQIVEDHHDEVWTIKWSHNGKYVATASKDKICNVYELKHTSKRQVPYLDLYHSFTFEDPIAFVEWSFSDNFIAITSIACKAFVASIVSKKLVTNFECFQFDTHAVWLPDDTLLVGSRLALRRINGQTFVQHTLWRKFPITKVNCAYETHTFLANCIHIPTYVPHSNTLVYFSAAHPGNNNILNMIYISKIPGANIVDPEKDPIWKDRDSTKDFVIAETGAILGLLVSQCGRYLLINLRPFIDPPGYLIPKYNVHAIEKGQREEQNVEDLLEMGGELSPTMTDRRETLAQQCLGILGMFSGEYDSEAIIQLANKQEMHLWDLHKMKRVQSYQGHVANSQSDNPFMCWPTIGRSYLATGSEDGSVYLFHKAHSCPIQVLPGHKSIVNAVDFHPKKNLLVSVSDDFTIHLWGPPLHM
eukprot:Phypoly_transcript_07246.p1 GENE.Phypoly_transcript_07246~~Phypoly_transcript_07246.p1  ORF type:complete len:502 (+),score=64.31 Phypoly_transcript_07246:180-1508(+)